ncbi:MAG: MobF family relaxase [Bacteroidota bacterium]
MLRINVSKGASATLNYFKDDLAQQDYYTGQAKCIGTWHGKLKERLGLSNEVNEENFKSLIHNRHPTTGEKLTVRDAKNRRCGVDFTFNAPKSVSVLHAITKDKDILLAHRKAVQLAMQEVENNMQTQGWANGEKVYEKTGNLLYAAFEHHLTRPVKHGVDGQIKYLPDCHLHVHAYVLNATFNENKNRYQAIEIGNIKRSGIYYEAVYQNHLANELQAAGYSIERSRNGFEIAGVSKSIRDRFSNRTHEINQKAKEKGILLDREKDQLGARTRVKKHMSVDEKTMEAHWDSRLSSAEKKALFELKHKARTGEKEKVNISVEEALDQALLHYLERKSAVPEKQVIGYALKLGIDQFEVQDVKQALEQRKNWDIITGQKHSDTYLTTENTWLAEHQMKDFAVHTRHKFASLNSEYTIQRDFLNKGQREAINHVLSSEDQVMVVAGGAGTGKTTLFQEVKTGIEANGKKLLAFAPSAEASRGVLRDKGFEGAETIKKLLDQKDLQEQTKDQVILIDEAGMIGNQTMNEIFKIAKEQDARVILSGDWKQHTSVESGDALRLLEKDTSLPVARVKEVVRQKEKTVYRQAVKDLSDGQLEEAYQKLDKMGSIVEIEDKDQRHEQIANDYYDSITAPGVREKDSTYRNRTALVVSPTHAEGQAITGAIRDKLKEKGIVGQKEQSFPVYRSLSFTSAEKQDRVNYYEGMIVQFYQNSGVHKAGTSGQVSGFDQQGNVLIKTQNESIATPLPMKDSEKFEVFREEQIELAKGDLVRITGNGKSQSGQALNNGECHQIKDFTKDGHIKLSNNQTLDKDYRHLTLGYYRTSHSSQGRDADDVFIAASATSFPASNEKQHYVSVSRGVERCFIYTDDKEQLKWAISKDANRMSADEVLQVSKDRSATFLKANLKSQQQNVARQEIDKQAGLTIQKIKDNELQKQPLAGIEKRNARDFEISF